MITGDWRHWDVVVPMRTQPLHLGHVRMVRNLAGAFGRVRVVIGNQPPSPDDPFPYGQRRRWWRITADVHGLSRVEFVRGAHGRGEGERVAVYTTGLSPTHTALVTGNAEVAAFWRGHCPLVLDIRHLPLYTSVAVPEDPRLMQPEGLGSIVRRALATPGEARSVRPLVPAWVWDEVAGWRAAPQTER